MVQLSVNINKVATVRNSRGGTIPDVVRAARACVDAGAHGITVHPRSDERHIRAADVRALGELLRSYPGVEFNIEGDPRSDLVALVRDVRPHQCTLVPVLDGEVTSQGGWPEGTDESHLRGVISELRSLGVRLSVFIDARVEAVHWVKSLGADRVELFTEPFAKAFSTSKTEAEVALRQFAMASEAAHVLGLGVNAGHDLDLDNLKLFCKLPHLAEVSIGHALISEALFDGLRGTVRKYLEVLANR